MRKRITNIIVLLLGILWVMGCGSVQIEETLYDEGQEENQGNHQNVYFYNTDNVQLVAYAEYYDKEGCLFEEMINLEMYKVKNYEKGGLYHLKIGPIENEEGYLGEERLNIYFYVTEEKIYRLWSYVYQDGEIISFYDNDELVVSILDTEDKIIENGEVVCQREETESELEDGAYGTHFAITKKEKQIIYSRCDVEMSGDPGFYEWFTWEDGKGLVDYGSGFSAEAEILYLSKIGVL